MTNHHDWHLDIDSDEPSDIEHSIVDHSYSDCAWAIDYHLGHKIIIAQLGHYLVQAEYTRRGIRTYRNPTSCGHWFRRMDQAIDYIDQMARQEIRRTYVLDHPDADLEQQLYEVEARLKRMIAAHETREPNQPFIRQY